MFKTLLGCFALAILTFMTQLHGSERHIFCSENSCYTFRKPELPWNKARRFCKNNGSDLVSIETEDEWNFINDIIRNKNISEHHNNWYIGLEKKAGKWTWVNGRPLTICRWGENQPGDKGDVATIHMKSQNGDDRGLFSVFQRNSLQDYICETPKVGDQDPSPGYCQDHIGIPCVLEYSKNGWIQICEFNNYTCSLNCSVNSCSSNCYPVKFCAKNCSKAYRPLVDDCPDTIYDDNHQGWSRCNTTKCNLTSAQHTFGIENTCHYEGDQCNLKCSGINCTQTCKEKVAATERPSTIRSQPSSSFFMSLAPSLSKSTSTSPSSISSSLPPLPSNAIQKLANDYVSKLDGLDSSRNTSLREAVNVFENFLVRFESMKNVLESLSTMTQFKTGRESIFKVAIAFEEFALNYSKQHLKGAMLSEEIVSHEMVLRARKVYRQNASDFHLEEHEGKTSINISSRNFAENGSVVVGCFYKNLHELLPNSQLNRNRTGNTRYVATKIIMAAMDPTPEKLLENVNLKFRNVKIEEGQRKCMFWSGFSKSSDGFSDQGCHVVTSKSNSEETVCSCNHLTHFAVLLDYDDNTELSKQDETVLKIITNVGSTLSIIGILLTIAMYTTLTDVRQPLSQIRLSLSASLGVGHLTFLAGINAHENPAACVAIAALMQYFLMAAFCWMLVEGIYFYFFIVKVYNVNTKLHMYHVIAWGLPMIMVAISLGIAFGKEGMQSYTSDKYCWVSSTNKLIWIFIAFVAFVEVLNILILLRVIREMTNLVQPIAEESHFQQIRLGVKACVVMSPLLGITWLFGFLSPVHKAFAYISTILNSTQGFLIFVLHGMRNTQIRERLKETVKVFFMSPNEENSTRRSPQVNSSEVGDARALELQCRSNSEPKLHFN